MKRVVLELNLYCGATIKKIILSNDDIKDKARRLLIEGYGNKVERYNDELIVYDIVFEDEGDMFEFMLQLQ